MDFRIFITITVETYDKNVKTFYYEEKDMIKRDFYLNKIIERMWDGNIKVITGIRRGGKSTLLFDIFKDYLLSTGVKENNIIEIELDKRKYFKFRDPIYLCEYVESIINENNEDRGSTY